MTLSQWFIFFLAIQVIHALGTWKLYVKAGRKAWESIVPIYNAVVLMQIINRPKYVIKSSQDDTWITHMSRLFTGSEITQVSC